MLLPHAHTLAQARSYLAALADQASTTTPRRRTSTSSSSSTASTATSAPTSTSTPITEDRAILLDVATAAIEELEQHGVDPLTVELILGMLDDAYALDGT